MPRILYLQLPRLENAARAHGENLPLAGFYLQHSLERDGLSAEARFVVEAHSDAALLDLVAGWKPDLIAATLYLWNVERTLHILRRARRILPSVRVVAGGPEVAPDHPFLFRYRAIDTAVCGEGEMVFPGIARKLLNGQAERRARRSRPTLITGGAELPDPSHASLANVLPPPSDPRWQPDAHGMAYLETGRGCPLRCAYCRYPKFRRRPAFLLARDALERAAILRDRGAREIRFVDPTLNANPEFDAILHGLARLNRDRRLRFFGELLAERLTPAQIDGLARAGFTEIEAGVQSRDPAVLRAVRRPDRLEPLEANLERLARAGIRVTLDLMYGLPGQTAAEVRRSLRWAWSRPRTTVQCMQTLLLPGSELRARRREWGLQSDDRPPYGIRSTPAMNEADIRTLEDTIARRAPADCPTSRFVGERLPDLFAERLVVDLDRGTPPPLPRASRVAMILRSADLFAKRDAIGRLVRGALAREPHALWQFVLDPAGEEPLDLLDELIADLRAAPPLWTDRPAAVAGRGRLASRRIFIRLRRGGRYSRSWIRAADAKLSDSFH